MASFATADDCIHPHRLNDLSTRCHRVCDHCHFIHLKRRTESQLCLHCHQHHPWAKTNARPPRTVPLIYCWHHSIVSAYDKSNKFQNRALKITIIIPVSKCNTGLVLTAIPKLNICTAQFVKIMMIMPSPLAPSGASSRKLRLKSWARHKTCRQHWEMCEAKKRRGRDVSTRSLEGAFALVRSAPAANCGPSGKRLKRLWETKKPGSHVGQLTFIHKHNPLSPSDCFMTMLQKFSDMPLPYPLTSIKKAWWAVLATSHKMANDSSRAHLVINSVKGEH